MSNDRSWIRLTPDDQRRKFVVSHEYGHAHLWQAANLVQSGADPEHAVGPIDTSCEGFDNPTYSMQSKEWSSLAHREGWAHFVSAAVWNNRDIDGHMRLGLYSYGLWLDVAESIYPHGGLLRRDCCSANTQAFADSLAGAGTNHDWLRALWALYADTSSGAGTSLADMILFHRRIVERPGRTDTNLYTLSYEAVTLMGLSGDFGGQVDHIWEDYACMSGIAFDGTFPFASPLCP